MNEKLIRHIVKHEQVCVLVCEVVVVGVGVVVYEIEVVS